MTIDELIANGQRKLELQADSERIAKEVENRKRENERQIMIEQFMSDVRASVPDYLLPHVTITEHEDNPGWAPGYEETVTFRLPHCTDITFRMRHQFNPDKSSGRTCDYIWFRPGKEPKYWVQRATETYLDYEFDKWVIRHETLETSDIEIALAWAHNEFVAEGALAAEAEKRNARIEADLHTATVQEETRALFRAEREQVEREQRAALVAELVRDPIAFRLLQAMSAVMTQRESWQEQLDLANDRMNEQSELHDEAMRRVTERANEQIHRAGREAEEARRREEDARDEASGFEKKLKQAERGW